MTSRWPRPAYVLADPRTEHTPMSETDDLRNALTMLLGASTTYAVLALVEPMLVAKGDHSGCTPALYEQMMAAVLARAERAEAALAAKDAEIERLQSDLRVAEIGRAFDKLAVKERDYERVKCDRLAAQVAKAERERDEWKAATRAARHEWLAEAALKDSRLSTAEAERDALRATVARVEAMHSGEHYCPSVSGVFRFFEDGEWCLTRTALADTPAASPAWMLRCDQCGAEYAAHEDLRGTGAAGTREARKRARADGWLSKADTDLCPDCTPAPSPTEHVGKVTYRDRTPGFVDDARMNATKGGA